MKAKILHSNYDMSPTSYLTHCPTKSLATGAWLLILMAMISWRERREVLCLLGMLSYLLEIFLLFKVLFILVKIV